MPKTSIKKSGRTTSTARPRAKASHKTVKPAHRTVAAKATPSRTHTHRPPVQWAASIIVGVGIVGFMAGTYLLVLSALSPASAPAPATTTPSATQDGYDVRVESEVYTPMVLDASTDETVDEPTTTPEPY